MSLCYCNKKQNEFCPEAPIVLMTKYLKNGTDYINKIADSFRNGYNYKISYNRNKFNNRNVQISEFALNNIRRYQTSNNSRTFDEDEFEKENKNVEKRAGKIEKVDDYKKYGEYKEEIIKAEQQAELIFEKEKSSSSVYYPELPLNLDLLWK
ncbi:hypothetical protein MHBO_002055 [Bonamia ostreae]|uniref:GIY-YIG homing endonuclease n=1 Tax=Bonamia ostreae TaxID=126728 RepID=A0ABV2ALU8_9EUKA